MEDQAHLHPFPSTAQSVAEDEEKDYCHRGGNSQRDKEVGKVVPALQRLRRGVVFPEFR